MQRSERNSRVSTLRGKGWEFLELSTKKKGITFKTGFRAVFKDLYFEHANIDKLIEHVD